MHQDEGARPIDDARGSGIAHPGHCTPAVAALNTFRKARLIIINPPLTKSLPSGCLSIGMVSLFHQSANSPVSRSYMRSLMQAFGTARLGSRDFLVKSLNILYWTLVRMVTGGAFESEERR